MISFKSIRRLARIYRLRPMIVISEYGQNTESNHRVTVDLRSSRGLTGLGLVYPATDSGHAQAELSARSLHNLTGLPVLELRDRPEKHGHMVGTD